jgi:hypothetical protein
VQVRADWLEAARLGQTSLNPWTSVSFSRQHIAGYTEVSGPFPARFDAQSVTSTEVRLGLSAVTELNSSVTLTTSVELAHRASTAPSAKGQVVGLFDFNLGAPNHSSTWVRAGMALDYRFADNVALAGTLHVASNGRDPSLSGSLGLKMAF